jgi:4-amino-4-deoxy-L-arabinose transferase-like glycosyltransferase
MKPVRLPASATHTLPRWVLFALCLLYIVPGLIGRDPWKTEDAASFGVMWTMAHGGLSDWLYPHIVGLPMAEKGPLAYWLGAISIKLFGWLLGDPLAARVATLIFFLIGSTTVWYTTYLLGRRTEAQPLRLAFGGQPEPRDYGRTLADGALLIYLGCLGLLLHSHSTSTEALQVSLVAFSMFAAVRLFESVSTRTAITLGIALGLLALARGWVVPLAAWTGLFLVAAFKDRAVAARLAIVTLPVAAAFPASWIIANHLVQPLNGSPYGTWMLWNSRYLNTPSLDS